MPDKVTRILVIFAEIYLVWLVVSGTIKGLPTGPVFWIAVVVEVVLGFLTYNAYKRYLTDKSYRLWNFLVLALTFIGVVTPIALFFAVHSLKPAGGTWIIYLLTANSFYLYRIIKKEPMSRQDVPSGLFNQIKGSSLSVLSYGSNHNLSSRPPADLWLCSCI